MCLTFLLFIFESTKSQGIEKENLDSINESIRQTPIFVHKQWETSEEEIIKFTDSQPAFGAYKDNFFITGFPLNKSINRQTGIFFSRLVYARD